MKNTILLFFLTSLSYSQSFRTDIGSGTFEKLKSPMIVLDMMEKNKPIDIGEYFRFPKKLDMKKWKKYKDYVYSTFPNNDNSFPATDIKKSDNLWYERTYYSRKKQNIEYLFQIYFELIEIGNSIKIKNIEFREGNSIIKRDKQIKRLGDILIPPPPPAMITN